MVGEVVRPIVSLFVAEGYNGGDAGCPDCRYECGQEDDEDQAEGRGDEGVWVGGSYAEEHCPQQAR